jgi:hypothetical protein
VGTWGVALFSDDIAADLREDFRDLIGDGLSVSSVVDKLIKEYTPDGDPDTEPVFWLALSAVQWKLGRLDDRTKQRALTIIEIGQDLERWIDIKLRKKRETVLLKLKDQLLSPQPAPVKIPKRFVAANNWQIGEIIGFQLVSKRWVLWRVIGHHTDHGGKTAVCELLDWVGDVIPEPNKIKQLKVKKGTSPYYPRQYIVQEPHNKKPQERIWRTGIISKSNQKTGGYGVFAWKHIDIQFKTIYGLE